MTVERVNATFKNDALREAMEAAGLTDVKMSVSGVPVSAAGKRSAKRKAAKPKAATEKKTPKIKMLQEQVTMVAVMSIPRYGANASWGTIQEALSPWRIPIRRFTGAYWGQCMQRAFENVLKDGLDWLLTIDHDSMISSGHIDKLMGYMGRDTKIDAITALQAHRGTETPLITKTGCTKAEVTGEPIQVTTAHFGLTLIRVASLKAVEKPWFFSQPDMDGEWGDLKVDADIWFWQQWEKAGNTIYVAPDVRIGHLQESVRVFDERMKFQQMSVEEWRKKECPIKKTK